MVVYTIIANAALFLPRLIERQSSRAIRAKKKRLAKQSAATHPQPTIELFDLRQIRSLVTNDIAGVAVVMPCIDAKIAMNTARLLACRAGMDCRIIVVNDTLRRGFIRTLNDTAARISVRYIVYLA